MTWQYHYKLSLELFPVVYLFYYWFAFHETLIKGRQYLDFYFDFINSLKRKRLFFKVSNVTTLVVVVYCNPKKSHIITFPDYILTEFSQYIFSFSSSVESIDDICQN